MKSRYWTGANDIAVEGRWVWNDNDGTRVDMDQITGVWDSTVSGWDWIREEMGYSIGREKLMHAFLEYE